MSPIEIVMKSKVLNSISRVMLLVFCFLLILPFQNCAVYESEGRKVFSSSLEEAENKGCYPYVDTNIAAGIIGALDGSISIYKSRGVGEDAHVCDFHTETPGLDYISLIKCKASSGNSENAIILKDEGITAFMGAVSDSGWVGTKRSGFRGDIHGGYVTQEIDGTYIVKYLAVETGEYFGVGCSVRMDAGDYGVAQNLTSVKNALAALTQEMSIGNDE